MRTRCAALLLLLSSFLVGCDEDPSRPPVQITGTYRFGFETSALEPCGLDQSWWVTNPGVLAAQYESITGGRGESVFVSVVGDVSEPGHYGHFDAYAREFAVTEVIVMRELVAEDCK